MKPNSLQLGDLPSWGQSWEASLELLPAPLESRKKLSLSKATVSIQSTTCGKMPLTFGSAFGSVSRKGMIASVESVTMSYSRICANEFSDKSTTRNVAVASMSTTPLPISSSAIIGALSSLEGPTMPDSPCNVESSKISDERT